MAQACSRCGGTGRGSINPETRIWEAGPLDESGQPQPCPDCETQLEDVIKKDPAALTITDANGKVIRKLDPESLKLGVYIDPQKKKVPTRTAQYVDDDRPVDPYEQGVDAKTAGFSEAEIEQSAR